MEIDIVSCPDPPSGGCGEREKEGLGTRLRSTGRLTLGATKEQRSGFEVVRDCFTEGGDSVVGVFCLELLRAKLPRE